jgi:hypothetical protein
MTVMRGCAIAIVLATIAGAVSAADTRSGTAPKPDPAMRQLDYFVGTWLCAGRDAPSTLGPAHSTQTRIEFVPDLDGVWLAMHWQELRTADNPFPWKLENAFTYDASTREFVFLARDNTGVASSGASPGWRGGAFVITGDFGGDGKRIRFRDTYTKNDDRSFDFVTEIDANGGWTSDALLSCQRQ